MQGVGCADVLFVLQVPDNKADAVPCERLHENCQVTVMIHDRLRQCRGMPERSFRIGPQVLDECPGHDQAVLEHNGYKPSFLL